MLHLRYPKVDSKAGVPRRKCRECGRLLDQAVLAFVVVQGGEIGYANRELWFHPACVLTALGWDEKALRTFMLASVTEAALD